MERLQKIIASRGIMSRRAAEKAIADGCVTVDGVVMPLGSSADELKQTIAINGVPLPAAKPFSYIALYKPRGVVTTRSDEQGRRTVIDVLPEELKHLLPVGRLDLSSEGLLVMTNDGDAIYTLTHPSNDVPKTYLAWVTGEVIENLLPPKTREISPGVIVITIFEGKNRQVRHICEDAGLHVTRLKRISEGVINIGTMTSGEWRYLTDEELRYIRSKSEAKK